MVEQAVAAVREAGAEMIDLFGAPELKGSRLARHLSNGATRLGLRDLEFTGSGAAIAASFVSRTADVDYALASGEAPGAPVGVLGIGHHSVGLAVGEPGRPPVWSGSRPVGFSRLAERSRLSDPAEPSQLIAARSAVERALAGFAAPHFGTLVAVSDFSLATRTVASETLDAGSLEQLLASVTGMTADEISVRTGLGPRLARLFPIALTIQQAAARTFDIAVRPVDPDPAALGLALSELSDVGA